MVNANSTPELLADLDRLRGLIDKRSRVVVAYSGGVDSALVYAVAHERLGDNAVAVTAVSPSLARHELEESWATISRTGGRQVLIDSAEVDDPRYRENTVLRCYFCKNEVFSLLVRWARENHFDTVMDGTNADDVGDQRPGRKAARELGIRSPLLEAGLGKEAIRSLARYLGLPNWNKPPMACLSSRIPYGTPVTEERLAQVEYAEDAVRALGLTRFRVRHHGDVARIEVEPEDFSSVLAARDRLIDDLRRVGFTHVSLDLAGYRQGSLNEKPRTPHGHDSTPLPPG